MHWEFTKRITDFKVGQRIQALFFIGATTASYDLETEVDQTYQLPIDSALILKL
jgi:hypothetical protein